MTATGLLLAALLAQTAPLPPEHVEFFEKKVRPVLVERCYKCHSAQAGKAKGGLLVDTRDALLKGGDSGPALVPGQPEASLLIKAIRHADDSIQMPEKQKLPDEQIADISAWVKLGAPDPRVGGTVPVSLVPVLNLAVARQFWSFKTPAAVAPPSVKDASWARTPVDAFILRSLESAGIAPGAEADRRNLLRRVTYDLTGLPPTAEETEAFLADQSPGAYERVIERLLASPRHGERWGRHWLDVARYADTKEWVVDEERRLPYPWTYRDWVIRAFNEDLPYDQFVRKQLAADRLPKGDPRDLAALGFLTVGRSFLNRQPEIIDDRIDVLGRGLLGLTLGCARCHDHKYDPVTIKDYYALYGIFASSSAPKEAPLLQAPVESPAYAAYRTELAKREGEIATFREKRRTELSASFRSAENIAEYLLAAEEPPKTHTLNAAILKRWTAYLKSAPAAFALWRAHAWLPPAEFAARSPELWKELSGAPAPLAALFAEPPGTLREAALRYGRALQDPSFKDLVEAPEFPASIALEDLKGFLSGDDQGKLKKFRRTLEELNFHAGAPARAMALEESATPHKPRVFIRGNASNPGEEVPRRFLELFSEGLSGYATGGRLELAQAITGGQNPLTARVWVNRVWAQHFGAGLVRTPSDFGSRGDRPTHPELLDWLARWFVEDAGWSTKKLHRLLLTSSVYRQEVRDDPRYRTQDPQNLLLWRANRRRLDLESMRDSLLSATGTLDVTTGGPSVELADSSRRTVYGWVDRLNLANLHKVFDFPIPDMHAPQRHQTSIPQQALYFLNNPFVMEQAKRLAARPELGSESDPARRLQLLYRRLFGRAATERELSLATKFLSTATSTPVEIAAPAWQYGWGTGAADFHVLPHFTGQAWQGGSKLPDAATGWCLLTAVGGHAGNDAAHGVIRRWTAPAGGTLKISGTLSHDAKGGDGVRGRLVSSRGGELASWVAARSKAETTLQGLVVEAGETIDFIVDCRSGPDSDGFSWAPVLSLAGREFNAQSAFAGPVAPPPPPLAPWEKLAHVLLLSNEFLFLD